MDKRQFLLIYHEYVTQTIGPVHALHSERILVVHRPPGPRCATGVAVVIVHHIGKSNEVRDPEDLWRGASRLADCASTRVTLLPHFRSKKDADDQDLNPVQARRYADELFLRSDEPCSL